MKKCQNFLSENFPFLVVKFSIYLNRRVFIMPCSVNVTLSVHLLCYFRPFMYSLLCFQWLSLWILLVKTLLNW